MGFVGGINFDWGGGVWVGGSYGWKEERGSARRRRGCVSAGPRCSGAGGGVLGVATRAAAWEQGRDGAGRLHLSPQI
jgi:hypothetical protein